MNETAPNDPDGDAGRALYPHLFEPLEVQGRRLRNRAVMGSMHTGLEDRPDAVERLAAYYAARAAGGIPMIVTGGYSPDQAGRFADGAPVIETPAAALALRPVTDAVHAAGGLLLMQLLHAGRYSRHRDLVAPSPLPSPINPMRPREMTGEEITGTVAAFGRAAALAREAGYDGVEVMGSEGYLITQFTAPRSNQRTDEWGGSTENRLRFPIEVVRAVREAAGDGFIVMYRISALDLVPEGLTGDEILDLARGVEAAGADIVNTGIGWHEARVPTIAAMVPRGTWTFATRRIREVVEIPVVASNRINMPDVAEEILASGAADMVSMARPMLADPDLMAKARSGRAAAINTCIACNQACLDLIFSGNTATCLVNPRAGRESEPAARPATTPRDIAVVGAGPAGLAAAVTAAGRGHRVTLYEAGAAIGGQLNLARAVPGKDDFDHTLRYFRDRLATTGVVVRTGVRATADGLIAAGHRAVVVAAGVVPRVPAIPGIDHPRVLSYIDVLTGRVEAGARVAIIGAGGIGFDVAEYLTAERPAPADAVAHFLEEWGVDTSIQVPGGLKSEGPPTRPVRPARPAAREVWLLQRKKSRPGKSLGLTTGWVHRLELHRRGVQVMAGVDYLGIDDAGLHIATGEGEQVLPADHVVVCAGQEPLCALYDEVAARGIEAHLVGGAREAGELDAMRAIAEGTAVGEEI